MKKHRQMLNFYRLIFFCRKLESNQYQNLTRNPFYQLNYIGYYFLLAYSPKVTPAFGNTHQIIIIIIITNLAVASQPKGERETCYASLAVVTFGCPTHPRVLR